MELWNKEYPASLVYENISQFEEYLESLTDQFHIILKSDDGKVFGWYFDFIRAYERWFAAIISSEYHGKGFGTGLINKAKLKRELLNGWVIDSNEHLMANGRYYKSPLDFYRKMGFKVIKGIKLETGKFSAIKIQWKRA